MTNLSSSSILSSVMFYALDYGMLVNVLSSRKIILWCMKYRDILENLVTLPDEWRGLKFEGGKSLIKVWLDYMKPTKWPRIMNHYQKVSVYRPIGCWLDSLHYNSSYFYYTAFASFLQYYALLDQENRLKFSCHVRAFKTKPTVNDSK